MAITIYLSLIFLALYLVAPGGSSLVVLARQTRRWRTESREGGRVVAKVGRSRTGNGEKILVDLPEVSAGCVLD